MLSMDEIKSISFRRANFGGYKPEDVDAFIDQVLITMEQLRKEKSDLIKKMDILATRVEEYRADEDAVRNAMLSAQKVADSTIKEARQKAARMIEESENLAKAKLYDLNIQIKEQKKQYTLLLAECNRLRDDIVNNCNKHIVIANDLPSAERIQAMTAQIDSRYPTDNSNDYEHAQEIKAPETAKEEKKSEIKTQPAEKNSDADTDTSDVNIVSDFSDRDNFDVDRHDKISKKKGKAFGNLKFGDDYDVEQDSDDDTKN